MAHFILLGGFRGRWRSTPGRSKWQDPLITGVLSTVTKSAASKSASIIPHGLIVVLYYTTTDGARIFLAAAREILAAHFFLPPSLKMPMKTRPMELVSLVAAREIVALSHNRQREILASHFFFVTLSHDRPSSNLPGCHQGDPRVTLIFRCIIP